MGPSVSSPNSRCPSPDQMATTRAAKKSGFTPLWLIVCIGICDICDVSKILVSYQSGPNFFVSWMNGPSSICVYFQNIHEHWRMKILTEEQSKLILPHVEFFISTKTPCLPVSCPSMTLSRKMPVADLAQWAKIGM